MAEIFGCIMLQVNSKKRIEYIDCLRGLCIFWVVWYHSFHPEWVEYPFRMPTLFFVSGIFFKQYDWSVFWRKKINQYVIPFVFFYILYYVFLLTINYLKYHTLSYEILSSVLNVFSCYSGNNGYVVNYPLWFMIALLIMQIVTYLIRKINESNALLLLASVVLTLIAHYWLWYVELPFFIGKALSFYLYYALGVVIGKKYVAALENCRVKSSYICFALLVVVLMFTISENISYVYVKDACVYLQFAVLPFVLLFVFRNYVTNKILNRVFLFMGANSLVMYGLHDMYLSIQRIILGKFLNLAENSVWIGLLMVLVTILAVYPSVVFFEKCIPVCIGKKPLLSIKK